MPVLHATQCERQHVPVRSDYFFFETFNIDSLFDVLPDVEVDGGGLQQVHDLLVVNLQVAALDEEVELGAVCVFLHQLLLRLNVLEDVLEGPLDDALVLFDRFRSPGMSKLRLFEVSVAVNVEDWALNRVGFAGSGLPVSEYRAVVALHAAVGYWLRDVIEDCGLVDLLVSHEVEAELLGVEAALQEDGALVNLHALRSPLLRVLLSLVEWPHPNTHFDVVLLIRFVFKQMFALLQI